MTPSIMFNGVACIPAALHRLTTEELRNAACRTDGKVRMQLPKRALISQLSEEGYRCAINPGTGIRLVKR